MKAKLSISIFHEHGNKKNICMHLTRQPPSVYMRSNWFLLGGGGGPQAIRVETFRMPFWSHHWLDLQQFSSTFWLQPLLPYGGAFQFDLPRKVLQKIVDFCWVKFLQYLVEFRLMFGNLKADLTTPSMCSSTNVLSHPKK